MNISPTNIGHSTNYVDLRRQFPEYFYNGQAVHSDLPFYDLLFEQMPIRHKFITQYTNLYLNNRIQYERSFPSLELDQSLPNLVELTMWWITYLSQNSGYHGMRSLRTPSSTKFESGVLCVHFLVNTHLGVSTSFRS